MQYFSNLDSHFTENDVDIKKLLQNSKSMNPTNADSLPPFNNAKQLKLPAIKSKEIYILPNPVNSDINENVSNLKLKKMSPIKREWKIQPRYPKGSNSGNFNCSTCKMKFKYRKVKYNYFLLFRIIGIIFKRVNLKIFFLTGF